MLFIGCNFESRPSQVGLHKHKKDTASAKKGKVRLCTYQCKAGGGGGQGMRWGSYFFQKFAVKFPAHGQIVPVKCNQISPPLAAHYPVKYTKAGPKKGTIRISPNKSLKSLFILRYRITSCSCYSCNYTF